MGKWLAAIAKGLSYAAGPFKPGVDFLLRLYDGELAERADKKIQEMISENKNLSLEIIAILREIKQRDPVSGPQFVNGATAIVDLIRKKKIKVVSPEQLEEMITPSFFESEIAAFFKNDFASMPTLVKECLKCWGKGGQILTLLAMLENLHFDTSEIAREVTPYVQITGFINQLFSPLYDSDQRIKIIGGLADRAKGSEILRLAHQLLILNSQNR
jgi:hypothetical protein